jgi:hypothetical protein
MALAHSPGVVTNGLSFYYDMSNTQKSFKGQPTTNQFLVPTPDASGYVTFAAQGTTGFQRIYAGTYGGYTIQPTDIVYKYVLGATGCHYHGQTQSVPSGTVVTFSFDYYVDPSSTGYPQTNYLANMEGVAPSNATDPTPTITGVWKRAVMTATASSTGSANFLMYPGACGDRLALSGFILYKNPQVEYNSFATPFTTGTRTTSNNLVDLTGRSTPTAGALTYASDNTFSYDYAAASYVSVPLATAFNKIEGTINLWVYPTRYNGGNGYFVNREDATANAVDWLWIGPYSDTFYFRIGDGSACCSNDLSIGSYSTVVPLNTWTNMTFTWRSGGTSEIYKNGVLYTSRAISTIPSTSPAANGRFGLGHSNLDSYYSGKMPVAQIYNRQLTAREILQNFNALRGRYGI